MLSQLESRSTKLCRHLSNRNLPRHLRPLLEPRKLGLPQPGNKKAGAPPRSASRIPMFMDTFLRMSRIRSSTAALLSRLSLLCTFYYFESVGHDWRLDWLRRKLSRKVCQFRLGSKTFAGAGNGKSCVIMLEMPVHAFILRGFEIPRYGTVELLLVYGTLARCRRKSRRRLMKKVSLLRLCYLESQLEGAH